MRRDERRSKGIRGSRGRRGGKGSGGTKIEEEGKKERLLQAVYPRVVADQGLENGQDVAAVLDYPLEHAAQARLALRFAVPFGKNSGRDLDVAAQLFRRVAAQKQPIEKSCQMAPRSGARSEEHTSELQSRLHLVCRLLLEKKK